jgi:hypothetical protein
LASGHVRSARVTPRASETALAHVVADTPRGSRNEHEYDEKLARSS